jgi:hypothetical protein
MNRVGTRKYGVSSQSSREGPTGPPVHKGLGRENARPTAIRPGNAIATNRVCAESLARRNTTMPNQNAASTIVIQPT